MRLLRWDYNNPMTLPSAKIKSAQNREQYQDLPIAQVGICRIRHDKESPRARGSFPYLSRFYDPKSHKVRGLPEPVNFYGGKIGNVKLAKVWQDYFDENNSEAAQIYTYGRDGQKLDSGWVNKQPWPTVRQVGWGGAYVVVTKITNGRAYIECYDNSKTPADYARDYLQQFSVVYTDDTLSLPDCGKCLTFAICNPGEKLWMNVEDLTFFRALPATLPREVITETGAATLSIRATAGGAWIGSYDSGSKITILETDAGALWGRTDRGWVSLQYTSWGR